MGCGVSTMDAEDATRHRHSRSLLRPHKMPRPVTADSTQKRPEEEQEGVDSPAKQPRKSVSMQGNDVILVMKPILVDHDVNGKQDCLDGKKMREKRMEKQERVNVNGAKEKLGVNEENEEENDGRDDVIKRGPGSLSFRDYCLDYDSESSTCKEKCLKVDPSFKEYCNGHSRESSTNESDDYSTRMLNKPQKDESFIFNKEPKKRRRRGKVFGNVEKSGRKKKFLNFSRGLASDA